MSENGLKVVELEWHCELQFDMQINCFSFMGLSTAHFLFFILILTQLSGFNYIPVDADEQWSLTHSSDSHQVLSNMILLAIRSAAHWLAKDFAIKFSSCSLMVSNR